MRLRCLAQIVFCLLFLGVGSAPVAAQVPAEKTDHAESTPHDAKNHEGAAADHSPSTDHSEHAKHDHNAFEHVVDSRGHWIFIESLGIAINLPTWEGILLTGISKFMILELIAAGLIFFIYKRLAKRMQNGDLPRGAWDNAFEGLLTFIRDDVAKPNLGDHEADKYVPFLWTLFLFILFNNLLGMFPFMGSPTANLYVTTGLAVIAFVAMHACAIAKMGFLHYLQSLWPHMDVPFGMGYILKPMIFVIEIFGTFIKSGVLAVRLFANMFAGHTVLAMILSFIIVSYNAHVSHLLWGTITLSSVLGVVALSLLELFVAFLQSYIFVFLTALFMGMALHPQH